MTPDIFFGEGDTAPILSRALVNPDGSIPDLTGATATFRYRSKDSLDESERVTESMTIVDDPTDGVVEWHPSVPVPPGEYNADIHVVLQSGDPITFPNGGGKYWMSVEPAP